jgi:hypothetical protein
LGFSGLVLGLLVERFAVNRLLCEAGRAKGIAFAVVARVVRFRTGLGELGESMLRLLLRGFAGGGLESGEEKRKRFRVFLFLC